MAWPTPIPSNATTGVSTAINDTIAAVQSWKGIVNANNNNLANVGIAQVGSLYVGGQPFNGYNTTEVVAVATGNPQVWNFTAKNFNGKPVVYFDGAKQPTANYSIAGTVAPLAFLNSGFESGLTSWGVGTTTGISTVNPHGGTKSAFISTASGSLSQTVSGLTSGTSYTITVQMRGDAGTSASAFLRASNGSGGAATTGSTVAATTSWQTLTVVYTADSTGAVKLELVRGASGAGTVYFDDVVLFGPVAFLNPGFESDLTSWTASDFGILSVNPHSGTKAAVLYQPGYLFQAISGFTVGNLYVVTAYVRGDAGSTIMVSLSAHDGTGANATPGRTVVLNETWQQIDITYTANATGVIGLSLNRGGGSGTAAFDDVVLSGGYASQTFAITFATGCQPFSGEAVTVVGDILT